MASRSSHDLLATNSAIKRLAATRGKKLAEVLWGKVSTNKQANIVSTASLANQSTDRYGRGSKAGNKSKNFHVHESNVRLNDNASGGSGSNSNRIGLLKEDDFLDSRFHNAVGTTIKQLTNSNSKRENDASTLQNNHAKENHKVPKGFQRHLKISARFNVADMLDMNTHGKGKGGLSSKGSNNEDFHQGSVDRREDRPHWERVKNTNNNNSTTTSKSIKEERQKNRENRFANMRMQQMSQKSYKNMLVAERIYESELDVTVATNERKKIYSKSQEVARAERREAQRASRAANRAPTLGDELREELGLVSPSTREVGVTVGKNVRDKLQVQSGTGSKGKAQPGVAVVSEAAKERQNRQYKSRSAENVEREASKISESSVQDISETRDASIIHTDIHTDITDSHALDARDADAFLARMQDDDDDDDFDWGNGGNGRNQFTNGCSMYGSSRYVPQPFESTVKLFQRPSNGSDLQRSHKNETTYSGGRRTYSSTARRQESKSNYRSRAVREDQSRQHRTHTMKESIEQKTKTKIEAERSTYSPGFLDMSTAGFLNAGKERADKTMKGEEGFVKDEKVFEHRNKNNNENSTDFPKIENAGNTKRGNITGKKASDRGKKAGSSKTVRFSSSTKDIRRVDIPTSGSDAEFQRFQDRMVELCQQMVLSEPGLSSSIASDNGNMDSHRLSPSVLSPSLLLDTLSDDMIIADMARTERVETFALLTRGVSDGVHALQEERSSFSTAQQKHASTSTQHQSSSFSKEESSNTHAQRRNETENENHADIEARIHVFLTGVYTHPRFETLIMSLEATLNDVIKNLQLSENPNIDLGDEAQKNHDADVVVATLTAEEKKSMTADVITLLRSVHRLDVMEAKTVIEAKIGAKVGQTKEANLRQKKKEVLLFQVRTKIWTALRLLEESNDLSLRSLVSMLHILGNNQQQVDAKRGNVAMKSRAGRQGDHASQEEFTWKLIQRISKRLSPDILGVQDILGWRGDQNQVGSGAYSPADTHTICTLLFQSLLNCGNVALNSRMNSSMVDRRMLMENFIRVVTKSYVQVFRRLALELERRGTRNGAGLRSQNMTGNGSILGYIGAITPEHMSMMLWQIRQFERRVIGLRTGLGTDANPDAIAMQKSPKSPSIQNPTSVFKFFECELVPIYFEHVGKQLLSAMSSRKDNTRSQDELIRQHLQHQLTFLDTLRAMKDDRENLDIIHGKIGKSRYDVSEAIMNRLSGEYSTLFEAMAPIWCCHGGKRLVTSDLLGILQWAKRGISDMNKQK